MTYSKKTSIFQIISLLFGSILFLIGFLTKNIGLIYASISMFILSNIFFGFRKFKERIVFIVFQLTFALFLVIRTVILIFDQDIYYRFNEENIWLSSLIILVAVMSMSIFVLFPFKIFNKKIYVKTFKKDHSLMSISKLLFYISYICLLIVIIEKIIYSQSHTIFEYYDNFESKLPFMLVKIADMNMIILYVYLGTLPSFKKSRFVIVAHIIGSILTLGYGVRNVFVLNILTLAVYFVIRSIFDKQVEQWFSRKKIVIISIISPVLLIVLQLIDNVRRGLEASDGIVKSFLLSQGISTEVISFTIKYSNIVQKQSVPFSIGSIINYISQNEITRFIFGNTVFSQHTVEMALNGHHLGSTLAYLEYPTSYLTGVGMGSSYLAELYFDFSFLGIIIGTLFLTIILVNLPKFLLKNPYLFGFGLIMVRWIIYMPRDTFSNWLVQSFSLMNILIVIVMLIISHALKKKSRSEAF